MSVRSASSICHDLSELASKTEVPKVFCRGFYGSPALAVEEMLLRDLDWENLDLSDLAGLSESAAYLTNEGIRFVLPRILALLLTDSVEAITNEFVDTVLFIPFSGNSKQFCAASSSTELAVVRSAIVMLVPTTSFYSPGIENRFCIPMP